MIILLLIVFWLIPSFLVAFLGSSKSIGYWGTFLISLFFSPLVGLISAIVSSENKTTIVIYDRHIKEAEMCEFRGDMENAIKEYKNALYHLNQPILKPNKSIINHRAKKIGYVEHKLYQIETSEKELELK